MRDLPESPHPVEAAGTCDTGGVHEGFPFPPDVQGRPFNLELLGALMGAALHPPVGCLPCQAARLDDIAADADTFTRLAAVGAMMVADTAGGIPGPLLDPAAGRVPPLLARLWAAGADQPEADEAMYGIAAAATPDERRAAASSLLDIIVGHLATMGDA